MLLSKLAQSLKICQFNRFGVMLHLSRSYSTPSLNINVVNVFDLNEVCDAFN